MYLFLGIGRKGNIKTSKIVGLGVVLLAILLGVFTPQATQAQGMISVVASIGPGPSSDPAIIHQYIQNMETGISTGATTVGSGYSQWTALPNGANIDYSKIISTDVNSFAGVILSEAIKIKGNALYLSAHLVDTTPCALGDVLVTIKNSVHGDFSDTFRSAGVTYAGQSTVGGKNYATGTTTFDINALINEVTITGSIYSIGLNGTPGDDFQTRWVDTLQTAHLVGPNMESTIFTLPDGISGSGSINIIPEPSTWVIGTLGLIVLACFGRKKKLLA